MTRWTRQFDWGLFLAIALALLAAAPFLTRPGLPRGTDAELHVFRAAELGYAIRGGVLYPRWAPDFYYGYGYPIFNYYAPLTYYLANLFDLLPGVDIVGGVKAVFVLGLVGAAVGMYLFVRDLFGPGPGLLAAASYVFAPYVLFIDPHARGVLAEHFALGLFPLLLWAFRRLLVGGGRWALAGSALLLAAVICTHNLLGVVLTVFLLAYLVWEVVVGRRWGRVGRGLLALALGGALSAIFWLPMALELDAVELSVVGPGHFDFRQHFVSLGELLAPSRILDLGATAPRFRFNLGLAQWLLALAALGAWLRSSSAQRRTLMFFALCALLLVFLMLPLSVSLWEHVPSLAYLQFPWRLLGPAAAVLAVCAGGAVGLLPVGRWRGPVLGLGLAAILGLALPTMFPPLWSPDFGGTTPGDMLQFELEGRAVGTTSTGDYTPVDVEVLPAPQPTLVESYAGPGPVDKVNRATIPAGTSVEVLEHGPAHDRFAISAGQRFVLRLYTFYFPGWRAYVDGQEVPIELAHPEGFITVWVPPGEHEVLVRLEATPPRVAGTAISLAGLLVLVVALILSQSRGAVARAQTLDRASGFWLGGALLAFLVFKTGLVDRHPTWFRYTSPPGEAWAAQHAQRADLGGQIELLGYDLPSATVRSGGTLPVTVYWRAQAPLAVNYQSFVHLTRPSAHSWGQSDHLNPGYLPTTRWPLDQYVWDEHEVAIRPGTPPGQYTLEVGLYTLADGRRLPVLDASGQVVAESVTLETPIQVLAASCPPAVDSLGMDAEVGAEYGGQVKLLGYTLPHPVVGVPGFLHLILFWRAQRGGLDDLTVRVAVVDVDGEIVAEVATPPVDGYYPTTAWSAGEVVRDPYSFWLEEDFAPGTYSLRVAVMRGEEVLAGAGSNGWLELCAVQVERRE